MANETMKYRRTSSDVQVGTAGTGVTVVEKASGVFHVTEITIPSQTLITYAGGAALAGGKLLYTLPAGTVNLIHSAINVTIIGSAEQVAKTPEVALGTVIGSGAIATLGASVATMEDILGPFVAVAIAANGSGGVPKKSGVSGTTGNSTAGMLFVGTDTRTVHLNIADTWAAGAGSATVSGTVWLTWIAL